MVETQFPQEVVQMLNALAMKDDDFENMLTGSVYDENVYHDAKETVKDFSISKGKLTAAVATAAGANDSAMSKCTKFCKKVIHGCVNLNLRSHWKKWAPGLLSMLSLLLFALYVYMKASTKLSLVVKEREESLKNMDEKINKCKESVKDFQ